MSAQVLAPLLDFATRSLVVRAAMAPVLGSRGRWLAQQREVWQSLVSGPHESKEDAWAHGSPTERVAWLADLRAPTYWRSRWNEATRAPGLSASSAPPRRRERSGLPCGRGAKTSRAAQESHQGGRAYGDVLRDVGLVPPDLAHRAIQRLAEFEQAWPEP